MTINSYKTHFLDSLSGEYSPEEVGSFFYILTRHFIGMSRLDIALDPGRNLSSEEVEVLDDALRRLKQHEPVQYITGNTEFFGLQIKVNSSVLIPRPETEELVQWILEDLGARSAESLRILDIGTGSGCIAISLAKHLPKAEVWAVDFSESALRTARGNARENAVRIHFLLKDILEDTHLPEQFDVIVSNPPYVRKQEKKGMHKNVLYHEPGTALYVEDSDPLVFYRAIRDFSASHLVRPGTVYFEINQYLGKETEELLIEKNFHTTLKKDIFGEDRMLKGQLK